MDQRLLFIVLRDIPLPLFVQGAPLVAPWQIAVCSNVLYFSAFSDAATCIISHCFGQGEMSAYAIILP